uniref:Uncharacterized protein n=1 Tax=Arundo donax TaxID=35708 RepID=A0A0A9ALM8_ARUDO
MIWFLIYVSPACYDSCQLSRTPGDYHAMLLKLIPWACLKGGSTYGLSRGTTSIMAAE